MIAWVAAKLAHKFAPYLVVALAGLCVVLWGSTVYLRLSLGAARGEAAEAQAALTLAADANQSNLTTIEGLQKALAEAIGQKAAAEKAAAEMEAARRDYLTSLQRENVALRKARETEYARDSECAALRTTPVCRAVNDRLRALAGQD